MDKYGVKSTHEALKNKLINYISTVYLGKMTPCVLLVFQS